MKVKVNKDVCIGCGACQAIAPTVFEIEDDGLACAKDTEIDEDVKEDVIDALEGCPTGAIEEVKENKNENNEDNEETENNKEVEETKN